MKMVWCWRCKTDVAMLEDDEYRRWVRFGHPGRKNKLLKSLEKLTDRFGITSNRGRTQRWLDEYERITGWRETNVNAIWHHVISQHGEACLECGKPLRTPRAKVCAFCGASAVTTKVEST